MHWNFIKRRHQHRYFPVYILKKLLIWIAWYFVVAGWYFLIVLLLLVLPYQIPVKPLLTPLGRRKAVFTLLDIIFQNNVYVLLKFDWLTIFFLVNPPRKLKILNFSFLSSFSVRVFKFHGCTCSVLKSGKIFCRGNFSWIENDL